MDTKFVLTKTKRTGNYMIHRKINGVHERATYKIYNAYIQFGVERYNEHNIINVFISDSSNMNYNVINTLNRVSHTFEQMGIHEKLCDKYGLRDKTFFSFIKDKQEHKQDDNRYIVRLYLKYGTKAYNKTQTEVSYSDLKNVRCTIDIELGSLWCSEKTNKYGITLYATNIIIT